MGNQTCCQPVDRMLFEASDRHVIDMLVAEEHHPDTMFGQRQVVGGVTCQRKLGSRQAFESGHNLINGFAESLFEHKGQKLSSSDGKMMDVKTLLNGEHLEPLVMELFVLQDLNNNGLLEEIELIKLNEKIAMLHHGKDTDKAALKRQYKELFRSKLDTNGSPVCYMVFKNYIYELLDCIDKDKNAQELILEQFIAEAKLGREFFRCPSFESVTDEPFRSTLMGDVICKEMLPLVSSV